MGTDQSNVRSYDRPPCPVCNMNMITTGRINEGRKDEARQLKCLRCGHTETKPERW